MEQSKNAPRWTKESLHDAAKEYSTRSDFLKGNPAAASAAKRRGIWDDVCAHMEAKPKNPSSWNDETCALEAKKHKTRTEFKLQSPTAYRRAHELGIMDSICSHMPQLPKTASSNEPNLTPEQLELITKELRSVATNYKTRTEFKEGDRSAYNKAHKLGLMETICEHMGAPKNATIWNEKSIRSEAKKYTTRTDFQNGSRGAANAARRLGIWEEICDEILPIAIPQHTSKWNKETCAIEALKHQSRSAFKQCSPTAYRKACDLGIMNDICKHMKPPSSAQDIEISKEQIEEKAKICNTKTDFKRKFRKYYDKALSMGVLEEVCSHMATSNRQRLSNEALAEIANNYTTRTEFSKGNRKAYEQARTRNILDDICAHMETTPRHNWDIPNITSEAMKYSSEDDFKRSNITAYRAAIRHEILNLLIPLMEKNNVE